MKKIFVMCMLIAGMLGVITACQKADNVSDTDKNQEEDKKEDLSLSHVEGLWDGSIKVPDQPLHIIVSLQNDDALSGNVSIPVQGVNQFPLSSVDGNDEKITFTMDIQGQLLTFDGDITDDEIKGTFTQAGQSFPFELHKQEQATEENQEEGEMLSVDTEKGTLYGELEVPDGAGPYPVMIIIPGSGQVDRNGNTTEGDNNSLKMMADTLAEKGIASLRYDKRGAGKNDEALQDETDMHFGLFVKDAKNWVDALAKDEQFSHIGIIGHSQGSLVGMIAAQNESVDAFVSVAGAGSTIDELLLQQFQANLPDDLLSESEDILGELKRGEVVEGIPQALQSQFRKSIQPFLSSWIQYNPTEEMKQLDIPVLLINGTRDLQVPESEVEKLEDAKSDAELLIVDKMNHVLKEAPENRGENLETYWDPELPLADGLMDGMFEFLNETGFED